MSYCVQVASLDPNEPYPKIVEPRSANNAGILACRLSPSDSDEDDNGRNEEGAYGMAASPHGHGRM